VIQEVLWISSFIMSGNDYKELLKLGGVDDALSSPFRKTASLHQKYLNSYVVWISRFLGFEKRFVRASGCYVYDQDGKRYLDFLAGFGALNLGHEPPETIRALHQVENYTNILQSYLDPLSRKLAEYLAKVTPWNLCHFFFNSGTA